MVVLVAFVMGVRVTFVVMIMVIMLVVSFCGSRAGGRGGF
jgi:hypothetical protein